MASLARPASCEYGSEQQQQQQQPTGPAKRMRLALACNQCRKRKVRCDTAQPKCRNCALRNETCETTDLRNPENALPDRIVAGRPRARAAAPNSSPGNSENGTSPASASASAASVASRRRRSTFASEPSSSRPFVPQSPANEETISWISRAYHEQDSAVGNQTSDLAGATPDVIVQRDETPHRSKFMGGTSTQCLCRFIDLHLTLKGFEPATNRSKHGMRQAEEFSLPLSVTLPCLPSAGDLEIYMQTFFGRIWPLFPIVDETFVRAELEYFAGANLSHPTEREAYLTPIKIPSLVAIYAIVSIGADERSGSLSETSVRFLAAAYSLYAHVLASPYLVSVQALVLLAIALRGQVKEGQSWHVIGQAIRMAQSMGLHEFASQRSRTAAEAAPRPLSTERIETGPSYRIWWSCYALEKLNQMECGRPSILDERFDAPIMPSSFVGDATDYFVAWLSLAKVIGQICNQIYVQKPQGSLDLFGRIGALDQALDDWAASLPESLKSTPSNTHQHLASFLSLQLNHARITLLRVSIIFPRDSYLAELRKHSEVLPVSSYARVENGSSACASAARSIVLQCLNLTDSNIKSIILNATPAYLATAALALSILHQPTRKLTRADLELLNLATDYVEDYYARWIQDASILGRCSLLRERIHQVVDHYGKKSAGTPAFVEGASSFSADSATTIGSLVSGRQVVQPADVLSAGNGSFEQQSLSDLDFGELWTMMGSDFFIDDETIFPAMTF